ncbi:phosphatidylinositol transfer protein 3-like [Phoenix dactylifera]|uniref:Phosphatidylinositol transfer protein 3-like n=1 Tax=Phoenix dactylifera TaxID=42345 RepID=A0A8B7CXB7_PHODC|nr:phosphatidylinositol transfer protein 3-like [Phoenix dactylifera]
MSSMNSASNGSEKQSVFEEQRAKIGIVRASLGTLPDKLSLYCSDASIARYLAARNWNVKKATKMLKETLKWRLQYKPEEIRWEEVANEAETGKIYRTNYFDKHGRSILVMRPGCQNTKSTKGQIRYLVYCMENAIINLPPEQEQMVWLVDFHGFNLSNLSVKVTKETAHVLQDHYPERLGLAILYNPPKFFESFWMVVKPFLEPKTYRKVKFVYSDDHSTKKIMEELFNMDELECAFGGHNQVGFNINDYAQRMREDDKRIPLFWSQENASMSSKPLEMAMAVLDTGNSESDSDQSDKECEGKSGTHMPDSECSPVDGSVEVTGSGRSGGSDQQSVQ